MRYFYIMYVEFLYIIHIYYARVFRSLFASIDVMIKKLDSIKFNLIYIEVYLNYLIPLLSE